MFYSIIEFHKTDETKVFIIWGENQDDDGFMTDKNLNICGFLSLDDIEHYLIKNDLEIIPFSAKEILAKVNLLFNQRITYSYNEIEEVLNRNEKIENIDSDNASLLLAVFNLISDYFYQIKNEKYSSLMKNKNVEMFFDYCYYKYFWNKGKEWEELEEKLPFSNYEEFSEIYKKLLNFFLKSIKMV